MSNLPDDFTSANMPPLYRGRAQDIVNEQTVQRFNDLAHFWREIKSMMESVHRMTANGTHSHLAVAHDLAGHLQAALNDADVFGAIHLGDTGTIDDVHKAIDLLTRQAEKGTAE